MGRSNRVICQFANLAIWRFVDEMILKINNIAGV